MIKRARKAAVSAILLVVVVAIVAAVVSNGGKSALDQYKASLKAKGDKLTFAGLSIGPSTNLEEIASRQLLASNLFSPPASPIYLMIFTGPGRTRLAWRDPLRFSSGVTNPTSGDWADFISKYQKLDPVLALSRQALQHPAPDTGWVWEDTYQNLTNYGRGKTFVSDRILAQALANSTMADLHAGDFDTAFANLQALASFANANKNELTLVHQMIRVAIAGVSLSATWEALQAPGWDEPRLAAIQREWEGVNLIEALERGVAADRAYGAVLFKKLRNSSGPEFDDIISVGFSRGSRTYGTRVPVALQKLWYQGFFPLYYKFTGLNTDESLTFTTETRVLEAIRQLDTNRPWSEVNILQTNLQNEFEKRVGEDRFHQYMVSALIIPNFNKASLTAVRMDTQRRLTIAAIAIKSYQLKNGAAPPNLAALTPDFLASIPIDPMSGKPLCYRLRPAGTFTLYSTGEDGRDDGGDPTPANPKDAPGLWTGRDAVWPTAATTEEQAAAEAAPTTFLKK